MTHKIIELDGKRFRVSNLDILVFTPDTQPVLDLTGQPLKVGTKVAWGTSYRGGGGAVIGEITSLGHTLTSSTIYEVDANDELAFDLAEAKNYRNEPYRYKQYRTRTSQEYRLAIETKSLTPGRKGNRFSDPNDVVAIANQDFGA